MLWAELERRLGFHDRGAHRQLKGVEDMTIRYAGLALMAGVLLAFVAPLFMPGSSLIDPEDQTVFATAQNALGDSAVLAQWMTFLTLISLLLMSLGFLGSLPLASRQGGLGGRLLQFGIVATLIEWSILMVATGMRHFDIHLMHRSNLAIDRVAVGCRYAGSGPGRAASTLRRSHWHSWRKVPTGVQPV